MQTATINPRASVLNRTMIVSKRSRRPGLPEVYTNENSQSESATNVKLPNSARIVPRNHYRRETVTFESSPQPHPLTVANSPVSSVVPPSITIDAISNASDSNDVLGSFDLSLLSDVHSAFEEVEQIDGLNDYQKLMESKTRVLALIEAKDKEWNAFIQKQKKDWLLKSQICDLKLSVANRTSAKAESFCKICEECGIDFNRILRRESNAIHKLKVEALNDVGREPETPESDAELSKLTRERDSMSDEIRSLESNYSNLFKLYEKMRENCAQLKVSEDIFKNDLFEQNRKYNSLYALYNELLNDAQEKLNSADFELKRVEKENEEKTLGVRLALKRAQIQIKSIEVALESKTKENDELNKICNELLSKQENMFTSITESTVSDNSAR